MEAKKERGKVVARIVTRETREHVGYLYEWNTGERQRAWFSQPQSNVVFEDLEESDAKPRKRG